MENHKLKFFILLAIGYWLLAINPTNAQTSPQFMVSWQAVSYAPSWYSGKILPTRNSSITVSFELIDRGKIADLSKKKIRWYVNDELVQNENVRLGLKSYFLIANDYPGQDTEIRITIVDYKDEVLDKIIRIPIVASEAVIDAPYPNAEINIGANRFFANPFFFNIGGLDYLSFEWFIDNQAAKSGENNQALDLNVDSSAPAGFEINIRLTVKNLLDEMEFASKNMKMVIK